MKITDGILPGVFCILFMSGSAVAAQDNGALNKLYGSDMGTCLNNLNMLKTYSQTEYSRQTGALNADIGRATHYLMVRDQLSGDMRSVMDNIYQSRLTSRCQSIHNALFDSLLNQAGGPAGGYDSARGGS